ncbi:MAG: hypothetical protein WCS85_00940 [Candidatus Peribacteraceae bacterium]
MVERLPASGPETPSELGSLLQHARTVIGDEAGRDQWSEALMLANAARVQEKMERKNPGDPVTFFDVEGFSADRDRAQAERLLDKTGGDVERLSPADRKELIAAHLSLTFKETLGHAFQKYMDILERYKDLRAAAQEERIPFSADLQKKDAAAVSHLQKVLSVAERRLLLAAKVQGGAAPSAVDEQALRQELATLLSEDTPAGIAMASLLNERYKALLDQAGKNDKLKVAVRSVQEASRHISEANAKVKGALKPEDLARIEEKKEHGAVVILTPREGESPDLLRQAFKDNGLSYEQYLGDAETVRVQQGVIDVSFRERGLDNVERLAALNRDLTGFQQEQFVLATVRHHFDQAYVGNTTKPPREAGEHDLEGLRASLKRTQSASLDTMDQHLSAVDRRVLGIGMLEMTEDMWNKEGRLFLAQLMELVTDIETFLVPHFNTPWPGPLEYLRNTVNLPHDLAKEYFMGQVALLIGWPMGEDGRPVSWNALTPEQKAAMKAKQQSVRDAVQKFRASASLDHLRQSQRLVRTIMDDPAFQSEDLLAAGRVQTDVEVLRNVRIGADDIPRLTANVAAALLAKERPPLSPERTKAVEAQARRIVILRAIEQWREDNKRYNDDYAVLLKDIHNVVNMHVEWEDADVGFARRQWELLLLLVPSYMLGGRGGLARLTSKGTFPLWAPVRRTINGPLSVADRLITGSVGRKVGGGVGQVKSYVRGVLQPGVTAREAAAMSDRLLASVQRRLAENQAAQTAIAKRLNLLRGRQGELYEAAQRGLQMKIQETEANGARLMKELQQLQSSSRLSTEMQGIVTEYFEIEHTGRLSPLAKAERRLAFGARVKEFQKNMTALSPEEYEMLARTTFPSLTDTQLALLKKAHGHAGPLEEKLLFLRGIDPATKAPLLINGAPVNPAEAFTKEGASRALRVGVAGKAEGTAVLDAPAARVLPERAPPVATQSLPKAASEKSGTVVRAAGRGTAETGAEAASGRAARLLGHLGFLWMEYDTLKRTSDILKQTKEAKTFDESATVDAALQFWKTARSKRWFHQPGSVYDSEKKFAQTALNVTGDPQWIPQETLVLEQLKELLMFRTMLTSLELPRDATGVGPALEKERRSLLEEVSSMTTERSKQMPVYRKGAPLLEQAFTKAADGRINVNTSGNFLGFLPTKFRNGPIETMRSAGAEQRSSIKFDAEAEERRFTLLRDRFEAFQRRVREYALQLMRAQ